jgi:hypothetical protein
MAGALAVYKAADRPIEADPINSNDLRSRVNDVSNALDEEPKHLDVIPRNRTLRPLQTFK